MGQRKVIPQGKGGLTVYLPKSWVDKRGLKGGDLVDIEEVEGKVIIGSKKSEHREYVIEINVDTLKLLKQILVYPYRMGYDSIVLKGDCSEIVDKVQDTVTKFLLGFEVTTKSDKQIIIESISEPDETKFETMLRRLFLTVQEQFDILIKDLEAEKISNFNRIKELRLLGDKYLYFCKRAIKKEKYNSKVITIWQFLNSISYLVHTFHYLYEALADEKTPKNKAYVPYITKIKAYFNTLIESFYKKEIKIIANTWVHRNSYLNECEKLLFSSKISKEEQILMSYMWNITRHIASMYMYGSLENVLEEEY